MTIITNVNTILRDIRTLINKELTQLDHFLNQQLQSKIPFIQEVVQYIIRSGGKRLRPILVILTAQAAGYLGQDEHVELATVVEFIHTATLLHDDVVDGSALRRGKQTANDRWGNQSSILVGDFLYSRAFQVLAKRSNIPIMKVLAQATNVIAEGEVLQLLNIADLSLSVSRYLEIIQNKTAMLFEAATHIGALLGSLPTESVERLRCYGRDLGIAFQIVDDILDYTADEKTLGKNLGDDLSEGKLTLPLIFALETTNPEDRSFIETLIRQEEKITSTQLQTVLELLNRENAFARSMTVAKQYTTQALAALECLAPSPYRTALEDLCHLAIDRMA